MDEVAYARAVRRVVVIAENIQTRQPAARNAGDIGEQVEFGMPFGSSPMSPDG